MNTLLLSFATWIDSHQLSTDIHESYYMYNWVETTHVLTLMLFLGMLLVIDLRVLGLAFPSIPVTNIANRLDKPMIIGFVIMVLTGFMLFYAIPVRTTQSLWFRIKVVLLIAAGLNAFLFRRAMQQSDHDWEADLRAPKRFRVGAALSLGLWVGVIATGRMIAYDWFDCHKQMPEFVSMMAGCVAAEAN